MEKRGYDIVKSWVLAQSLCAAVSLSAREVADFDTGWRFKLGDLPQAKAAAFDDSSWRALDVPHDWAFEADYAEDAAQTDRGGYKPGGIGWYRKTFEIPDSWSGRNVRIEFDAVFMNSEVWINGKHLGKRPYGYISFDYDLTPHLKPGRNVVAVRVDSSLEPAARWYHGCGIYGHVKLVATGAASVAKDGIYVTTPGVSDQQATVSVETELAGKFSGAVLETVVLDPTGKEVAKNSITVDAATVKQTLTVKQPMRWDVDTPDLYTLVSRIADDEVRTRFGIRAIRWEAKTGFWINEKNVKLKGVCDHSEAGPVGAAYPDELLRWKLQLLKDMGCNAIRTAHNPQTPIFYDLCDEMGFLVMDEIFDGWKKKAAEDYGKQAFAEWWERDLRAWLKRDRNHPCVVVWSVGNETRGDVAKDIVRVCHEVDPTRLVTSGHANPDDMDIEGVNGHSENQQFFAHHKTDKPFVSTEAPHTWQVRGFYRSKTWWRFKSEPPKIVEGKGPFPCPDLTEEEIFTYDWTAPGNRKKKQQFNPSYDTGMTRITARKNWELARDLPWHSGHFRWTGFDYLGEAGYVHGGWPFRAFMGGPLDLAGFEKDLFYFYQSQWTTEPMVHILPHWTHPKMEAGTKVPVWVYSNCDAVELFLNGKSLGKDKPGTKWDEMQCDWMVPWTPGKIEAVGYKGGKEIVRASQTTADVPAKLALSVEGEACPIITVVQQDKNGVMNPYAENRIHYHIDGSARILSLESGNPVNTENNIATSRTAFFGLARAFLQTTSDEGPLSVVVGAICGEKQLMTSDKISIDVQALEIRGEGKPYDFKILYSTDGSKPSAAYTGAFAVDPNTVVKADVFAGEKLLFSMEEKFGRDEGIYWPDENAVKAPAQNMGSGEQAEDAKFKGAKLSSTGEGFEGKGYLDFGNQKGAYVEWYQENDGSPGPATLAIRYSGKRPGADGRAMKLTVNGKVVDGKLFFPNTAGYGTDWKMLEVKIKIDSGANHIRLTTIEKGGMCIDAIEVR